jgi:hypothetical protein
MINLFKSFTFLSGLSATTALTTLAMYRDVIVVTLDTFIGVGKGDSIYMAVTAFVGMLGTFGIGKGRLDADNKPSLHQR